MLSCGADHIAPRKAFSMRQPDQSVEGRLYSNQGDQSRLGWRTLISPKAEGHIRSRKAAGGCQPALDSADLLSRKSKRKKRRISKDAKGTERLGEGFFKLKSIPKNGKRMTIRRRKFSAPFASPTDRDETYPMVQPSTTRSMLKHADRKGGTYGSEQKKSQLTYTVVQETFPEAPGDPPTGRIRGHPFRASPFDDFARDRRSVISSQG